LSAYYVLITAAAPGSQITWPISAPNSIVDMHE